MAMRVLGNITVPFGSDLARIPGSAATGFSGGLAHTNGLDACIEGRGRGGGWLIFSSAKFRLRCDLSSDCL